MKPLETETNRRRRELAKKRKGGKSVYVDWIRVRVIYAIPAPPPAKPLINKPLVNIQLVNPPLIR